MKAQAHLKLIFAVYILFAISCTRSEPEKIDASVYAKETQMMLSICSKFANEVDAGRLHQVAVATESAIIFKCAGYSDVCMAYGDCLSASIQSTKDKNLSSSERAQIYMKLQNLTKIIKSKSVH